MVLEGSCLIHTDSMGSEQAMSKLLSLMCQKYEVCVQTCTFVSSTNIYFNYKYYRILKFWTFLCVVPVSESKNKGLKTQDFLYLWQWYHIVGVHFQNQLNHMNTHVVLCHYSHLLGNSKLQQFWKQPYKSNQCTGKTVRRPTAVWCGLRL